MEKLFNVRLQDNHPEGEYHRSGFTFISRSQTIRTSEVLTLSESQMTDAIRNDPWLVIEEVPNND